MCVTGYPDLDIGILGNGDLLDIVKFHKVSSKGIFKYLKEIYVGITHGGGWGWE